MTFADLIRIPTVPARRAKVQALVGVLLLTPEIVTATARFAWSMIRTLYRVHLAASPIRATAPSTQPSGPPPAASAPSAPTNDSESLSPCTFDPSGETSRSKPPVGLGGEREFRVRSVGEIPTPPQGGLVEVFIPLPVEGLEDGSLSWMAAIRAPLSEN